MWALAMVTLFAAAVVAQTPSPPPPAPAPAPGTPQQTPARPPADTFTYSPDGRRDPFLSLIGSGADTHVIAKKGEGAGGLNVAEISVTGVMDSRGVLVAMIQGPDKKTYVVHQGDKLADATIKSVTPQGLVMTQEVNDPLSLVKQREIRKLLRSLEDGKQ